MSTATTCTELEVGKVYGRLTILGKVSAHRRDRWQWKCRCACGTEMTLNGSIILSGNKKSCGCYRRDRAGHLYRKHGLSKTPQYTMFYDARKRAMKLGLPFTITPEHIQIPEDCPVLGFPMMAEGPRDFRPSLDRRVPAHGYTPENIQVISFRANRIKSDATPDELRRVLLYTVKP